MGFMLSFLAGCLLIASPMAFAEESNGMLITGPQGRSLKVEIASKELSPNIEKTYYSFLECIGEQCVPIGRHTWYFQGLLQTEIIKESAKSLLLSFALVALIKPNTASSAATGLFGAYFVPGTVKQASLVYDLLNLDSDQIIEYKAQDFGMQTLIMTVRAGEEIETYEFYELRQEMIDLLWDLDGRYSCEDISSTPCFLDAL